MIMNNIEKPITIKIDDTRMGIANVLDSSGLAPAILQFIIKEFYDMVNASLAEQIQRERMEYENLLREQAEAEKNPRKNIEIVDENPGGNLDEQSV